MEWLAALLAALGGITTGIFTGIFNQKQNEQNMLNQINLNNMNMINQWQEKEKQREENERLLREQLSSSEKLNQQNIDFQREINNTVMQREDNSLQRKLSDAKEVGLSPLAAFGATGAPASVLSAPANNIESFINPMQNNQVMQNQLHNEYMNKQQNYVESHMQANNNFVKNMMDNRAETMQSMNRALNSAINLHDTLRKARKDKVEINNMIKDGHYKDKLLESIGVDIADKNASMEFHKKYGYRRVEKEDYLYRLLNGSEEKIKDYINNGEKPTLPKPKTKEQKAEEKAQKKAQKQSDEFDKNYKVSLELLSSDKDLYSSKAISVVPQIFKAHNMPLSSDWMDRATQNPQFRKWIYNQLRSWE